MPLANEPDNANGKENCVMISNRGLFRDEDCSSTSGFICKAKKPTANYDCKTTKYSGISEKTSEYCYWFHIYGKSWAGARDFCKAIAIPNSKADLLSIGDKAELKSIQKLVKTFTQTSDSWWIGLNDISQNGNYIFTDGTPYLEDNIEWLKPDSFADTSDDCWVLLTSGMATLYSCKSFIRPICKHSRVRDSESSCPPYWQRSGDSCYFAGDELMIWKDASDKCKDLGGHLLKTNSDDESNWLGKTSDIGQDGRAFWTGLNDRTKPGTFVWLDGSPLNNSLIKWDDSRYSASRCLILDAGENATTLRTCQAALTNLACEYSKVNNAPCPSGWSLFQSKCYYISEGLNGREYNWFDTINACNKKMKENPASIDNNTVANYITIENNAQLNFVLSAAWKLNSTNKRAVWLGLNSNEDVHRWVWASAPQLSPNTVSFHDFSQPDLRYECVVIIHGGKYRTYDCDGRNFFLCEKPIAVTGRASSLHNHVLFVIFIFCATLFKCLP